jgi:hypothetical protein
MDGRNCTTILSNAWQSVMVAGVNTVPYCIDKICDINNGRCVLKANTTENVPAKISFSLNTLNLNPVPTIAYMNKDVHVGVCAIVKKKRLTHSHPVDAQSHR